MIVFRRRKRVPTLSTARGWISQGMLSRAPLSRVSCRYTLVYGSRFSKRLPRSVHLVSERDKERLPVVRTHGSGKHVGDQAIRVHIYANAGTILDLVIRPSLRFPAPFVSICRSRTNDNPNLHIRNPAGHIHSMISHYAIT
jgi:hypothetical protein